MKLVSLNCPACGAVYDGPIRSGFLSCEYCGARFALDADELEALGVSSGRGLDAAEAEEEAFEDVQPYDEFTREACKDFLKTVGGDGFKSTSKILRGLSIDDDEEVFLIHDDTLLGSGKNGFAITDYGFYCREMGDPEAHYVSWGDFAECEKPYIDDSLIVADGVSLAYYTGNSDVREELKSLYRKLRKHAKLFDWSE